MTKHIKRFLRGVLFMGAICGPLLLIVTFPTVGVPVLITIMFCGLAYIIGLDMEQK